MKLNIPLGTVLIVGALVLGAQANDRLFTYSYEPETMAAGTFEFEQWVTLRALRNQAVGQSKFVRWDIRSELEYGVTDRYTVSLYLNGKSEGFRDSTTGSDTSKFSFEGVSLENRYLVLNPAEHPVGLTLYLEPRFSGVESRRRLLLILSDGRPEDYDDDPSRAP